ncbi:hypothetical protein B566_EDAN010472, partial [Ephemera danica]
MDGPGTTENDLMEDLKDDLSGDLEDIITGLLEGPSLFLATRLHKALVEGWFTDETAIIDIIAPLTSEEIAQNSRRQHEMPSEEEKAVEFKRFLSAVDNMDPLDENTFKTVLLRREPSYCCNLFYVYAIVESIQNRAEYFARRLYRAMDGFGTDEEALTRVLVSRAEKDLGNIKLQYERLFGRTLLTDIEVYNSNVIICGHISSCFSWVKRIVGVSLCNNMKFFASFLVIAVAQSISANPNLLGPDYQPMPTLRRYNAFNATTDAIALRGAMEGLGTAEEVIVSIITRRNENQRNQIEQTYNALFDRDLMQDFKDELTGCLKDIIVGLLEGPTMYLVNRLHKAIAEGWSTDKNALIDIIAPRTNQEIAQIESAYDEKYDTSLTEELGKDTSKHYRRLLMSMVKNKPTLKASTTLNATSDAIVLREAMKGLGTDEEAIVGIMTHRSEQQRYLIEQAYASHFERSSKRALDPLNEAQAKADAELLYNSGKGLKTSDEATFNMILTHRTDQHLRIVFKEYAKKARRSIEETIREEFSGPMKAALLTI